MSASYAAGTAPGPGSAEPNGKGSTRDSMTVDKLIGPRVVAAGTVTLSSGTATVTFPQPMPLAASNYIVVTQQFNSSNSTRCTSKTDSSSKFSSFAVAGTSSDVVQWLVIKIV
jgi:hypothetical protein